MRRPTISLFDISCMLIILAMLLQGCSFFDYARHEPKGQTTQTSQAVEHDINRATDPNATPAERAEAKQAVSLQERVDDRKDLFQKSSWALLAVTFALAAAFEFPLVRLPMNLIALGAGGFSVACMLWRALYDYWLWGTAAAIVIAAVGLFFHFRSHQVLLEDLAKDSKSTEVKLRGKGQALLNKMKTHVLFNHPPKA